ncbi:MAG: hypothetical protein RLZZ35_979 [Actinomycetota bacterium]
MTFPSNYGFVARSVRERFKDLEIDKGSGVTESVTGRIIFKRDTGKLCFATLREGDGTELQAMFSLDKVGEATLENWKTDIDLGDIVSVTGEVITSKRGELSILANSYQLASKALRPLPNEHNPLSEETRVRQRYVDLIVRPEARDTARIRPKVLKSLRDTFDKREFIEVETPMLQVRLVHLKLLVTPMTSIFSYVSHPNFSLRDVWSVASKKYLKSIAISVMRALIPATLQNLRCLRCIGPTPIGGI